LISFHFEIPHDTIHSPLAIIMRIQLTLIILFLKIINIYGQTKINGDFCDLVEYEGRKVPTQNFSFSLDYKFEYEYSFFGFEYGSGTYSIVNDSLILQFDKCPKKRPNELNLVDTSLTSGDSIEVDIKMVLGTLRKNQYHGVGTYCIYYMNDTSEIVVDCGIIRTDSISFTLNKQLNAYYIDFKYLNTINKVFELKGNYNSKWICILNDSFTGCIDGQRKIFTLLEKTENKLVLESLNNNDFTYKTILERK
jgi:hypothetical protein